MKAPSTTFRLTTAFCLLIGALTIVGWQGYSHLRRLHIETQGVFDDQWKEEQLSHTALHLTDVDGRFTLLIFLLDDQDEIKRLVDQHDINAKQITALTDTVGSKLDPGSETELFASIRATQTAYVESYQQALALLLVEHKREEARRMLVDIVRPDLTAYQNAWKAFDQHETDEVDQIAQQSNADYIAGQEDFAWTLALAGALTTFIAFFTVIRMRREIHVRQRAEQSLQEAYDQLEQRVRDRTAELEKANETLHLEINERLLANARLERLRNEHMIVLNSLGEGVHWIDIKGRIKFENPAAAKMLGYDVSELIGKPAHATMHHTRPDGSAYPANECSIYATLKDEKARRVTDEVFWRKDGTSFPVEYVSTPVHDENGDLAGAVVVFTDITERKKTERQLHVQYAISGVLAQSPTVDEAKSKILQTLCENLGWDAGGLWLVDSREGLLRCSEMWGAPNLQINEFKIASQQRTFARGGGLPGRVWDSNEPAWIHDVVQDDNFPRLPLADKVGLHGAFAFPVQMENEVGLVIELFSREPRVPDKSLLRIAAALGNQIGPFFQRKRLEDQLFLSQKMETVGKLAGGIAHEFNSIMTAIIGQSEMLLDDLPQEDPLAKNAIEIRNAADRAAVLTRQLLAYGRKQILQPEALNLNNVIANMEGMFRHLMGGDVDVRILPAPDLKPVNADAGQIEQVIMNMAMNARDAMPHGGKLTLETENVSFDEKQVGNYPELKPGNYVMLAISDTGSGMDQEVQERIFEPFFSTKGIGQGTGLGLATCYGIVKQSGGHISVYSEKDRGTTFRIYLPQLREEPKPRVLARDSSALPRGTETILLVEDDPALRRMASTLLERLGYTVLAAANGVDALSLIGQQEHSPIDLLFTDVVMPQMGGKELSDQIVKIYSKTKILFTSAFTENAIVHQGILSPGVALLQKPFTPSALACKMREVLDCKPQY